MAGRKELLEGKEEVNRMMTETAELRRVAALRNQMLLDDVPKGRGKEFRMVRHDEYDDGGRS